MSIKRNFIYSSVLTTSNYIFPLLTYPYVSRVLGVANFGLYNFVDSIINYFILFSMLGISIIGIREIASTKKDNYERGIVFSSLFIINFIFTIVALTVLMLSICYIPELKNNRDLMYVGVLKIVSNLFLIDWFYKGLEKFKYITNITLVIKIFFLISVFLFVKKESDYNIYYLLSVLMITFNSIANFFYARRYVKFDFTSLRLTRYMKDNLTLGAYCLLTSMYTSFNVAFLGFTTNNVEVGYYTTGTKLFTIIIALYTAFTGVVQPRMSSLLADNNSEMFICIIRKSIKALIILSVPAVIFTVYFCKEIVFVISGSGYEGAIVPSMIVMPLIFIIGYEQILVIQILTPLKKDKSILINSVIGALCGLILNIILVPQYKSIGSSIVWLVSEIVVLISAQFFVYKCTKVKFPMRLLSNEIVKYIPLMIFCYIIKSFKIPVYHSLAIGFSLTMIYVFIVNVDFIRNFLINKKHL